MRPPKVLALVAATGLVTACARPAATADAAGVRTAINNLRAAVNAGDSTAFFALTAEDFEVLPPGTEPLRADAARGLFRGLFTESSASLEPFSSEEIEVSGDLAMQRYSFRLTLRPKAGGAATTEAGSGLHIWRRGADGRWRLAKDIWTEPAASPGS
jgi:ketosteroid isomerase-like protein